MVLDYLGGESHSQNKSLELTAGRCEALTRGHAALRGDQRGVELSRTDLPADVDDGAEGYCGAVSIDYQLWPPDPVRVVYRARKPELCGLQNFSEESSPLELERVFQRLVGYSGEPEIESRTGVRILLTTFFHETINRQ